MRLYFKIFIIALILNFDKVEAQIQYGTFYIETLDSSIKDKIDNFFKANYPNHSDKFLMHFCRIHKNEDTIWYGKDGKEKFYLQKYLFVYTFSDSLIGIDNYLINLSFDLKFNVTYFNFPYKSRYKDLNFATKNDVIKEFQKYHPIYKDSIAYLKSKIIYDSKNDVLYWEICLEKQKNNFDCSKFEAIEKKLVEEYSKVEISINSFKN